MTQIASVDVKIFDVPLAEVLSDAKHGDHTHFELVTTTLRLTDGSEGTGYTYTGGKGGRSIAAMIEHDLVPFLLGKNATEVEALYDAMQWHVHYVARGGIASFASQQWTLPCGTFVAKLLVYPCGRWPEARQTSVTLMLAA